MNGNLEERISYCKFVIIVVRIAYVLLAFLSIVLFSDSEYYIPGLIVGLFCIAFIIANIFLKSYMKKLNQSLEKQYSELEEKRQKIMEERKKVANEINNNTKLEVDESKIVYTENDKKRIEKNCKIMRKKNLPYMEQMKLIPFEAIVKIKSKDEIVNQMLSEYFLARKALNRFQGISDMQDENLITNVTKYELIKNKELMESFSAISNGEVDELTLNEICYLFERVNVYMWILGFGAKPRPDKECYVAFLTMIIERNNNSINELMKKSKMISNEEILEYADLITRYEWAMIELDKMGKQSKNINKDSIMEQKKAMDWVTSFNPDNLLK